MAIIVVGGGGRGAGKTALVCGLMRALPEISWTAVKVTTHEHGKATEIWEETAPGDSSDTARYLAAGARRALLVTASDDTLGPIVQQVLRESLPPAGAVDVGAVKAGTMRTGSTAGVIFESNSILRHLRPDVCLCAATSPWVQKKPTYDLLSQRMDAMVELAGHDHIIEAEKLTFRLAAMERVSATMQDWLRERLSDPLP
ncbi:MAG: hypothetical protein ACLPLZ_13270 [Terracidiphilus sp.]